MANYSDEDVEKAFDHAPEVVQESLSGGSATNFIAAAQSRYSLHVDVIGGVSLLIRDLLLGLINPAQFFDSLLSLGLDTTLAQKVAGDVNQEIFIPLRNEMQKNGIDRPSTSVVAAPRPSALHSQPPVTQKPPVRAPQIGVPELAPVRYPQPQAVYATQTTWTGQPAGNWQPAAAIHVYVPGPVPLDTPVAQRPQPAPFDWTPPQTAEPVSTQTEQQAQATPVQNVPRPIPKPPINLPGSGTVPLEKERANDPYREAF